MLLLLPLLIVPLIIPSSVVDAAAQGNGGGTQQQVDIRTRSWNLAVFASNNLACGEFYRTNMSVDDARNANQYENYVRNAGYVVAPGSASAVDCANNGDNWLSSGLDMWGYTGDYQEFLYDLGYRQDGLPESDYNKPYSEIQLNDQEWYARDQLGGIPDGAKIASVIAQNGGPNANSPSADVLYYATYTNFVLGCEANPLKLASEATNNEKTGDKAYIIKDVDPATGAIREMVYTAAKGKGDKISTGPGVIGNTNDPTCQQLADQLNQANLINSYSTYWKNAVAAGNQPLSNNAPVTGDGTTGNINETDASCGDVGGAFGWLICAAADVVDGMAQWVEGQLYELLRMQEIGGTNSEVYTAWASVRNVATAVLVLVALVAIAAQVFNLDFISAYTMKKIIPRIVIASILLFVSYFLAALAIQFTNALGDGVGALIMGPFGELAEKSAAGEGIKYILSQMEGLAGGEAAAASAILLGIGATAFIGGAGLGGIILVLFLVGGAIAVAFITLVLRKVLILALVMAMPLAIIAWILPGTQKWFTSWWNLFTKLLLMYPLVIGLIAVGRVAAYLLAIGASTASGAAGIPAVWQNFAFDAQITVVLIMVLVAYFGPYYFIPSMFKTAGGLFSKVVSTLEGAGKKYGRKTGDVAGKKFSGYTASKYQAEKGGFRAKSVNALARTATGNIMPGTKRKQRTAAVGSAYSKERNEQADFLIENAYAAKGYEKGGEWLIDAAQKKGRVGESALRMIAETGRYDLLDKVEKEKAGTVKAYADKNRAFGAKVASNRKDILDQGRVPRFAPAEVPPHDSFFGTITKDANGNDVYDVGPNTNMLSQATIDQIRGDRDLYNKLGAAGKKFIDLKGGTTFPPLGGGPTAPPTGGPASPAPAQGGGPAPGPGPAPAPAPAQGGGNPAPAAPAPTPTGSPAPATPIINTPLTPAQKAQAVRNSQGQAGPVSPRLTPVQINSMDASNISGWLQARGGISDPSVTTQELIAIRNNMAGRMNEPGMRDTHTDITLELASRGVIADPTDASNQRPNLP
jgi:hypothetical protein